MTSSLQIPSQREARWFFTPEQIQNTPSVRGGLEPAKELQKRQQASQFIHEMGQKLQLTHLCMNTATVYMHRFFMFHEFSRFCCKDIGAAAIFLSAKVEECPRKLEHVVRISYALQHKDEPPLETASDRFLDEAQKIVVYENILLQTLGFDLTVDHPHASVVKCCQLVKAPKDLAQASYFLATDRKATGRPECLLALINTKHRMILRFGNVSFYSNAWFLSISNCYKGKGRLAKYQIPNSSEDKPWYYYIDQSLTPQLLDDLATEFLKILERAPPNKLRLRRYATKPGPQPVPVPLETQVKQQQPGPSRSSKTGRIGEENHVGVTNGSRGSERKTKPSVPPQPGSSSASSGAQVQAGTPGLSQRPEAPDVQHQHPPRTDSESYIRPTVNGEQHGGTPTCTDGGGASSTPKLSSVRKETPDFDSPKSAPGTVIDLQKYKARKAVDVGSASGESPTVNQARKSFMPDMSTTASSNWWQEGHGNPAAQAQGEPREERPKVREGARAEESGKGSSDADAGWLSSSSSSITSPPNKAVGMIKVDSHKRPDHHHHRSKHHHKSHHSSHKHHKRKHSDHHGGHHGEDYVSSKDELLESLHASTTSKKAPADEGSSRRSHGPSSNERSKPHRNPSQAAAPSYRIASSTGSMSAVDRAAAQLKQLTRSKNAASAPITHNNGKVPGAKVLPKKEQNNELHPKPPPAKCPKTTHATTRGFASPPTPTKPLPKERESGLPPNSQNSAPVKEEGPGKGKLSVEQAKQAAEALRREKLAARFGSQGTTDATTSEAQWPEQMAFCVPPPPPQALPPPPPPPPT